MCANQQERCQIKQYVSDMSRFRFNKAHLNALVKAAMFCNLKFCDHVISIFQAHVVCVLMHLVNIA